MDVRRVLIATGVVVSVVGGLATSIGLIPTLQYELALQAAEQAQRGNQPDVYKVAEGNRDDALAADAA